MADENESFTSIPVHMVQHLHQLTCPNYGNQLCRFSSLEMQLYASLTKIDGWFVCVQRILDNTLS